MNYSTRNIRGNSRTRFFFADHEEKISLYRIFDSMEALLTSELPRLDAVSGLA